MESDSEKVFIFWSKSRGKYATLSSLLHREGWQIVSTAKSSTLAQFYGEERKSVCLAILNPIGTYTGEDVQAIKEFILNGHKAIVASAANDQESRSLNNISELVEPFGVTFNEDRVIRPNPFSLYHPSEAVLEDFIVNRGLGDSLNKFAEKKLSTEDQLLAELVPELSWAGPRIVYPHGCTLRAHSKNATVMMSSSKWALPSGQPICVFHRGDRDGSRLIALGSAAILSDSFIDKEDNRALVCSLLEFITRNDFVINISDARTMEIVENNLTADMDKLLDTPIWCLRELEPLPEDKLSLVDRSLFSIDNSQLPEILRAYAELNVPERPLTLMRPAMSWLVSGSARPNRLKYLFKRSNGDYKLI